MCLRFLFLLAERGEHGVERGGELGVPVPDRKLEAVRVITGK
jgi:hypothetical protein